jgi:hypothetical protein
VRAFLAIVKQTVRSSIRSKVFHVLFGLILLAVFLLPITVAGDGTAMGQLQIALTYSLGVVVALISTTTLWLACSLLSREIEAYNLHMVTTKPCPRWVIWLGKWFGVFLMHAVILLISAGIIYGLIQWRIHRGHFSENEMTKVRNEVLVGRRAFFPETPDFDRLVEEEYQRRKDEFDDNHNPDVVKTEIRRQVTANSTEVAPGMTRFWLFKNVRIARDQEVFFLRYRHYVGSTAQSSQKEIAGIWLLRDPSAGDQERYIPNAQKVMSGSWHELRISPEFVSEDGTVVIGYQNIEPAPEDDASSQSVIFQIADGPVLLVRVTGFLSNYARSMILALFQIAFLAALGCTVGAAFSTPVAAFVAVSYLVIGMSVQAAVSAPLKDDSGKYQYKGAVEMVAHRIAQGVSTVVVSVDDFDATSNLARGRLIEFSRIGRALLSLMVLRGGVIALVGMWVLTRRELGAVIRR